MAPDKNTPSNKVPEIRSGDTVVIMHGKDAGKRGKVERILRNPVAKEKAAGHWRGATSRPLAVVISGINIAKRHTKPRSTGSSTSQMPKMQAGGILEIAQPMAISKVMVVCTSCERPTRVKHRSLDNGQRVRVCGHCGERLEVKG